MDGAYCHIAPCPVQFCLDSKRNFQEDCNIFGLLSRPSPSIRQYLHCSCINVGRSRLPRQCVPFREKPESQTHCFSMHFAFSPQMLGLVLQLMATSVNLSVSLYGAQCNAVMHIALFLHCIAH